MLKVELYEYGFEESLEKVKDYLECAANVRSKKKKDEFICKAFGMMESLCKMIVVEDDTYNK